LERGALGIAVPDRTAVEPGYGENPAPCHLAALVGGHYLLAHESSSRTVMRAEIQSIVDEIRQSVGLLRRHL
jgi:hypothetical protein